MKDKSTLTAVTIIAVALLISVTVLLAVRPDSTSAVTVLTAGGLIITQLMTNRQVAQKVDKVHDLTNSRMTALLEKISVLERAIGVLEGEKSTTNAK